MVMRVTSPGPVPKEALNYFRGKSLKIGFSYQDVWREEHACEFTVAKAMSLDILQDIHDGLDKTIAAGQTLRTFRNNLQPLLEQKGWWGRADVVDPATGEIAENAQLGSPRRLKTIFDANIRTANAAGQWERIERTKDLLPMLLRTLGPSEHHRPEHVSWNGILLPVDHPWVKTHPCPCGYGCKCRWRQVGTKEADKLKETGVPTLGEQILNPDTGLPTGRNEITYTKVITQPPPDVMRPWKNRRTGEVSMIPAGIDPGWDHNPGQYRQQNLEDMLAGKLLDAPRPVVDAAMRDLAASGRYRAWADDVIAHGQPRGLTQIIGAIDADTVAWLATNGIESQTPVIITDDKALLHSQRDSKIARAAAISLADVQELPKRLADAERYFDRQDPALVYAWDEGSDGKLGKAVVRVNFRKKGDVTNRVTTTGLIQPGNLAQYEKIPGRG